jgi:RNA recognition motif-containing protein
LTSCQSCSFGFSLLFITIAYQEEKKPKAPEAKKKAEESKASEAAAKQESKANAAAATEATATPSKEEAPPELSKAEAPVAAEQPAAAAVAAEDAAMEEEGGGGDERSKRVYVGNLAWQVSWQDLKDHMRSTGLEVVRANVITGNDGRSKGCGIVEFATVSDAQQAVETLNDTELRGRQIFVREDREDKPGFSSPGGGAASGSGSGSGGGHRFSLGEDAKSRRVYVGNLSWDVAWQDLKDHMKQAGDVVHAEVMLDLHSGRSKGCGVVEFVTEEGAQAAIETLTNTELKGRTIFVREDRESASASAGGRMGGGGGGGGVGGGSGSGRNQHSNPNVYVWNLAPETSWQDLKDHMRKAGNVDSASVFPSPDGGNGSGIVIYQRAQDAARAIRELQGTELHGVAMSLREDRMHSHSGRGGPGRGGGGGGGRGGRGGGRNFGGGRGGAAGGGGGIDSGTQVYVGNLSFDTTWRELKDHFRQCGDIKRAEVKSKGFGTVVFVKKEDANAAIHRLNGSELQGRKLEVRLDQKGH